MKSNREEIEEKIKWKIASMCIFLVSPHDPSESAITYHLNYNPHFANVVRQITEVITSDPLTEEKLINDMLLLQKLKLT